MTTLLAIIFTLGFRRIEPDAKNYFVYAFSGIIIINFFSRMVCEGGQIVKSYAYLLKKVNFQPFLLTIMKALSCAFFHCILLVIFFLLLIYSGRYPTIYWLQLIYYFTAMSAFSLGVVWNLAALTVILPDLRHLFSIGLQLLFYLSPVFWRIENVPQKWALYFKLNPLFYIINGYRDCVLNQKTIVSHPVLGLYFWGVTVFVMVIGILTFRHLRPYFVDTL